MAITDPDKQHEYAWKSFDTLLAKQRFAEGRGCELADEFTRLEVQIAAILFAFVGLFIGKFDTSGIYPYLLTAIVFFLVASLVLGLLHLKRKEKWWDDVHVLRTARLSGWREHIEGKRGSFQEALEYDLGAMSGRDKILRSPVWTWILQTIALGIAGVLITWLFVAFIFHPELSGIMS